MSGSHRMEKVDSLLQRELGAYLQRDVEFPEGVVVSVINVKTSKDLRHALVSLSILPEEHAEGVLRTLEIQRRDCEEALHRRLVMKFTPRLRFILDRSMERASHIEALLDTLENGRDA